MRWYQIVSLVCVALLTACASTPTAPLAEHISAQAVQREVNAYRAAHGLPALRYHGRLERAAQEQAMFQAARKQMSHIGFRGRRLDQRLDRARYAYLAAGENVSVGRRSEREVVAAWSRSASHRDMMLHGRIEEMGAAAAIGDDGRLYWALVMAQPWR